MFTFRWMCFIFLALSLAACGPIYKTRYSHVPPTNPVTKKCVARCTATKVQCAGGCKSQYRLCREQASQEAVLKYQAYRQQQLRADKPIVKSLANFDHSNRCKMRCQCEVHFDSCFRACGGDLKPYKVCTAFCDQ